MSLQVILVPVGITDCNAQIKLTTQILKIKDVYLFVNVLQLYLFQQQVQINGSTLNITYQPHQCQRKLQKNIQILLSILLLVGCRFVVFGQNGPCPVHCCLVKMDHIHCWSGLNGPCATGLLCIKHKSLQKNVNNRAREK